MKKINKNIEEFEGVMLDHTVLATLRYLQHPATVEYYTDLLDQCISAAIKQDELFSDSDALEIIRGISSLKEDLERLLIPEGEIEMTGEAIETVEREEAGEIMEESKDEGKEEPEWEE